MANCSRFCSLGLVLASLVWVGCNGESDPDPDPSSPNASAESSSRQNTGGESVSTSTSSRSTTANADPDRPETRWIGDIPYDVFFDDPLTIATNTATIGGSPQAVPTSSTSSSSGPDSSMASIGGTPQRSAPTENAMNSSASTSVDPAATAPPGEVDWAEVLPANMLNDEVKSLRTNLTANLLTVATYNRSIPAISNDGAMLSAMAAIATRHSGSIPWKDKAPFVRDLGYDVYINADGTGRESFTNTKEPFEKTLTMLDGGPASTGDVEEVVPFGDQIYVAEMMKRIQKTFNDLKSNINTPAKLTGGAADVERELRVLLALGTMMQDESYSYADEPRYQEYLKSFTGGARDAITATQTGSIDTFQSALNQIQTTCAECHREYRGEESAF